MKKILVLLILLISIFLLYYENDLKDNHEEENLEETENEVEFSTKRIEKKSTINKGVNVSLIPESEMEPPLSRNLRARLPDFQVVFSNLSAWNGNLTAEDFQIIRNLKAKIDNKKFFDVNDVAGINHLDDRNILNAIKQNNPSLINQMLQEDTQVQSTEDYNNEYVPDPEPPQQELQPEAEAPIVDIPYENNE